MRHNNGNIGFVRAFRVGHGSGVGVEYANATGARHNLDGVLRTDSGVWVNSNNLTVV